MKEWIYGKNMVVEAIRAGKVENEVILQQGMQDVKLLELLKKHHLKVVYQNKAYFKKVLGDVRSQGIMAQIEGYDYVELEDLLMKQPRGKFPLYVMLDGLEDPHNLGAILRTCDAVGVDGVIIGKNRSVGLNGTVAKVSTGAIHHVKVAQVTNLTRTLEDLKKKAFWIVGCELENSQDYRSVDYNMPTVLVIGSEGFGMSRLVKKSCDINVVLPMVGHVNSLNASVAASVLLYQVYNSRHPL